jgi:hypothetical protein
MRFRVLLALASLAASTACTVEVCAASGFHDVATVEGPGSIAYHVSADGADRVFGSYDGTLTNRDPEQDATVVLYRFIEPPSPDDLSGGEILGERFLPAARQHTFVVPLTDTDERIPIDGDSITSIGEWIVIEVLDASRVEVEIDASDFLCKDGREVPEGDVTWERAW